MSRRILIRLSKLSLMKVLSATPAPRWAVLLADMAIVAISCILTFTFNSYVSGEGVWYTPVIKTIIILFAYLLFSILFKSYQYIVRLSVIEDVYRIAMLVFFASVVLSFVAFSFEIITGQRYYSIWNIFIIGVFAFSIMMCMRLTIKYLYTLINGATVVRKPVIVLGSAINSFVLASALKNEVEGRFDPVALLSLSEKKINTTVNGIPIIKYDASAINDVFAKYKCDTLLFLSTQIELMRSGFADAFFENGIKLLMLNQVEEFDVDGNSMPNLSTHVQNIKIEDLLGREVINNNNPMIEQQLRDQVVLITGAAGSIGSEIVRQIALFKAKEIVLVDQAETPMHDLQLELEEKCPDVDVKLCIGDITNFNRMNHIFSQYRPRYVFHAAAYKHVPMMENNPSEAIYTNVFGTKNIADLSIKYDVDKFVMISTDKAVNPTNVMGASKRIAEIYVQSLFFYNNKIKDGRHTRFITTRFGNVLGSSGSVIPRFRQQIEEGGPVTVTHRDIIRYFMTIPEACSLVLEAGCMGQGGEIYIFDMGKPIKIYDLATRMISLAGFRPNVDIKIVETGLRPGEKLYEELLNDKELTLATKHKKIMIAKVRTYKFEQITEHIERLKTMLLEDNVHDIVAEMKHIVPEYKSQNSQWQKVDNEISEKVN
ncbi:MAG: polysaccharide biosynthesis protein [Muribaculaceae bacterium]|nr:polysaccharide biosynthesis protein [Muribaculaceae bacterium]MBQ7853820.1 polysaccharide biosynthesis protein [Muribaculaceae bacterium]